VRTFPAGQKKKEKKKKQRGEESMERILIVQRAGQDATSDGWLNDLLVREKRKENLSHRRKKGRPGKVFPSFS